MTAPQKLRWRLGRAAGPPGPMRRRIGTAARLLAALFIVGGLYTVFSPGVTATAEDEPPAVAATAADGKKLYESYCINCHGLNAQGVPDRGPSLIGVGSAAVEFQVDTGRMPLARQEAQAERKPPQLNHAQALAIGAYIQELGGGPQVPENANFGGGEVARGGEIFRINCSACHTFGGGGGALSSGKYAPGLEDANARDIYLAMLTGPQNMPVFGDNQLTPEEKRDVIAYVQNLQEGGDPGGWAIGRLGPVTEGLAIFLIGMVVLVFTTLWIAGKS